MPPKGDSHYTQEYLVIVSYNVGALNIREKHTHPLMDLKRFRTAIAFIQETHFQEG
ncbi:Hypothetical predicted protein, partial [Pelobates cultripes]